MKKLMVDGTMVYCFDYYVLHNKLGVLTSKGFTYYDLNEVSFNVVEE